MNTSRNIQFIILSHILLLTSGFSLAGKPSSSPSDENTLQIQAFLQQPGLEITSPVPGYLFLIGEKVHLTAAIRTPPVPMDIQLQCHVRLVLPAKSQKKKIINAGSYSLNSSNRYRTQFDVPIDMPGYYDIRWRLSCSDVSSQPYRTNLGVIPHNPQDSRRWDSPFGVNTHVWSPHTLIPMIRRAGIAWIRDHMSGGYDAKKGEYTSDDPMLVQAEKNHLCYLPLSDYFERDNPEGLRKEKGVWVFPAAVKKVEAYARRHRGRITHFEVYNEPQGWGWGKRFDPDGVWWQGGKWVKPFVDFAVGQTKALHRGDPCMKMVWQDGDIFLFSKLYAQAGATPDLLQVIAPHPYNIHDEYPENQPYITSMSETLNYLRGHGMTDQIWATELGWSTFTPASPLPDNYVGYWPQTEQRQAEKLARVMILHRAAGIAKTFWYDFYEDGFNKNDPENNFGLVRANPLYPANENVRIPNAQTNYAVIHHTSFEPKPALIAYANIIHWLEGAKWLGRYASGCYAYSFLRNGLGAPVVVAWSKKGDRQEEWSVPSRPVELKATDIYGGVAALPVKDGKVKVTLTESPIFIDGFREKDIPFREASPPGNRE